MDKYDYIIVGAGLYGAVFANQMTKAGKHCLVLDKRNHIGGNIYCEDVGGINVHKYGPHIFHTNKKEIWDFVCSHVEMNHFRYSPLANYNGALYNLPFNMNTFYQMWKVKTPEEAKEIIDQQVKEYGVKSPMNLEEQALSLIGYDLYHALVKGYSEKQWGRAAKEIPAFIVKRIPLRFTYNNNYFNDPYQGIPMGGYNKLIDSLLTGIEMRLQTDFLKSRMFYEERANKILFTGMIDQFYDYCFGRLEYRSLEFETETLKMANYQGNAAVNYTDRETPHTRIIEHKHFEFGEQEHTVITKEYPSAFTGKNEAYYPINDSNNNKMYAKYKERAEQQGKYVFGGRLGSYKYYNMDDTIEAALGCAERENRVLEKIIV